MTQAHPILLSTLEEGVLTLTLNRPDRLNALNPALMRVLSEALQDAADDARVGALLLRGNGRAFCAGGDIAAARDANEKKELTAEEQAAEEVRRAKRGPTTPEVLSDWLRRSAESVRLLHRMPKPTIAVVNGAAVGAGLNLAAACDFRVASRNATFQTGFRKVGYSGDFGGSYFLTRLIGTAKARELYLLDARLDAEQALRLGLVTQVVEPEQVDTESLKMALTLAQGPRIAHRYIKKNLNLAEEGSLEAVLDAEVAHQNRCSQTEDHKEAVRAMFEKRAPNFRGV